MTETEQAVMADHAGYWTPHLEAGTVVVFGVVIETAGSWGLAVVEADSEDEVHAIASGDPAVTTGTCTYQVGLMPQPFVRGLGLRRELGITPLRVAPAAAPVCAFPSTGCDSHRPAGRSRPW